MTRGQEAERRVEARLRAALPEPEYRVYVNVHWTGPTRWQGPARDGEADAVITHPEHGLLVLEVKAGEPSVDHDGHWHLGPIDLSESPFEQASKSKHFLRAKIVDLPDWPRADRKPRAGHAVAFPEVDLESLPRGHSLFGLGADALAEGVLNAGTVVAPLCHPDSQRLSRERPETVGHIRFDRMYRAPTPAGPAAVPIVRLEVDGIDHRGVLRDPRITRVLGCKPLASGGFLLGEGVCRRKQKGEQCCVRQTRGPVGKKHDLTSSSGSPRSVSQRQ